MFLTHTATKGTLTQRRCSESVLRITREFGVSRENAQNQHRLGIKEAIGKPRFTHKMIIKAVCVGAETNGLKRKVF